jgi:hypothetical protein
MKSNSLEHYVLFFLVIHLSASGYLHHDRVYEDKSEATILLYGSMLNSSLLEYGDFARDNTVLRALRLLSYYILIGVSINIFSLV